MSTDIECAIQKIDKLAENLVFGINGNELNMSKILGELTEIKNMLTATDRKIRIKLIERRRWNDV